MASRDTRPMTEEHKGLLTRTLPEFVSRLNISAKFWAILLSLAVLTNSEKQRIEGSGRRNDEDQALDLVQLLMKKSDEDFYSLIVALRRTDQLHLVALLEETQIPVARDDEVTYRATRRSEIIADPSLEEIQLIIQRSLMRTCSSVETWTWSADKNYVPISELFTDLVWVHSSQRRTESGGRETLGSYVEMFQGKGEQLATFVFLQGLAGSGKSTLVQMLVVKWCRLVQRRWLGRKVEISDQEYTVFSKFKYVLLIFPRHVRRGQRLIDIIGHQYCVEPMTADKLYRKILECQRETLIFMEGYDEFIESTCSEITDIAHRKTFKEATLMMTSRHTPSFHFPSYTDTFCMPDNHVLLKGFGIEGVSQYINNFFKEPDQDKAAPLLDKIKQSDELTDLSCFPAILLLMCTLWAHDGALSDSITGFFLRFVAFVCGRYESKYVEAKNRQTPRRILEKYHNDLMKIGEASVEGLREDKLQLYFPYSHVLKKIGKTAWRLGFLKRESNMEGEELVAFPHKTMQEFFTAFFTVNCGKKKRKELLIYFYSSVNALKESEMIQTFINGLGGEKIMEEINNVIEGSDADRAKVIPTLQLTYLTENKNAKLKLPARVYLDVSDRYRELHYRNYFSNDCSAVTHLSVWAGYYEYVTDRAVLPSLIQMSRLTELKFGGYSLSVTGLGTLAHILKISNIPLTTLEMYDAVGRDVVGAPWPSLMASLPLTLKTLDVTYNNITDESLRQLSHRVSQLKHLQVIKMALCNLSDARAVLDIIKNCQTLTLINVCYNFLGDALVEIVKLTPYMTALRTLYLYQDNMSDHVIDRIKRQFSKDAPQLKLVV